MFLEKPVKPDYEALLANLKREGTPKRVHYLELFLDGEISRAIINLYGIGSDISEDDPHRHWKMEIALKKLLMKSILMMYWSKLLKPCQKDTSAALVSHRPLCMTLMC